MEEYFQRNNIIYTLCRVRANYAYLRNKMHLIHLLSTDEKLNYHKQRDKSPDEVILDSILPPRRKWKKLSKERRYKQNGKRLNTIEYNTKCILSTVKYYENNEPNTGWLISLNKFINGVRQSILSEGYTISKPIIIPKQKGERKENVYRPISQYTLQDKIIIGIVNKYFTDLFDDFLYQDAYAFRSVKNKKPLTHHDSIRKILQYKKEQNLDKLWVTECDISKFFDTVNHTVIKTQLQLFVAKAEKYGKIVDERAISIFFQYLESYNFIDDVLTKRDDADYWNLLRKRPGKFEWCENELLNKHYSTFENESIGVPQGGALSGLISNLVLNYADEKLQSLGLENLLYVRYCDDMMIIHPDKKTCEQAIKAYEEALLELKLLPHQFETVNSSKKFWKAKSKKPYLWRSISNKSEYGKFFPWISFVGYEIHFDDSIRVRKKSFRKEFTKQKETIKRIKSAINPKHNYRRVSKGTVLDSANKRLIGMSVGRVELWNYDKFPQDMCWVNGFEALYPNSYLNKQLRRLDRSRNYQMSHLRKFLEKQAPDVFDEDEEFEFREYNYYGRPYSYQYHATKLIE